MGNKTSSQKKKEIPVTKKVEEVQDVVEDTTHPPMRQEQNKQNQQTDQRFFIAPISWNQIQIPELRVEPFKYVFFPCPWTKLENLKFPIFFVQNQTRKLKIVISQPLVKLINKYYNPSMPIKGIAYSDFFSREKTVLRKLPRKYRKIDSYNIHSYTRKLTKMVIYNSKMTS